MVLMRIALFLIAQAALAISLPPGFSTYHQDISDTQVRWIWRAAAPTTSCGYVLYGPGDLSRRTPLPAPATSNGGAQQNRATIVSDLQPGTAYTYEIHQYLSGCSGAEETSVGGSFTTLPAQSIEPVPPAAATDPGVISFTGSTFNVASDCSNVQAQIDAAFAANGALNHLVSIPAGIKCATPWVIPARSAGVGSVTIRSSAVGTTAFPPAGTRPERGHPGFVTVVCPNDRQISNGCSSTSGTVDGVVMEGIRFVQEVPYRSNAVTAVVQGGDNTQCGALGTYTVTTATNIGFTPGTVVLANLPGLGAGAGTANPAYLRVYAIPTATSFVGCNELMTTSAGAYTGGGAVYNYPGGLPITAATGDGTTANLTTPSPHGLTTGISVMIQGGGFSGAHTVTVTGATTFSIPSAFTGAYSGGAVMAYGTGFALSLLQLSEATTRFIIRQSEIGCDFPYRCIYAFHSAGGRDVTIRDSQIYRFTPTTRPAQAANQSGDFLLSTGYRNTYEGGSCVEMTTPGPLLIENNTCVGNGILAFAQEGNGDPALHPLGKTGNITVRGNEIRMDARCLLGAAGLYCPHRHLFELKAGAKVAVVGNVFADQVKTGENVNSSVMATITLRCGAVDCNTSQNDITDVLWQNNLIENVPGFLNLSGHETQSDGTPRPMRRIAIRNNVIRNMDGRGRTEVSSAFGVFLMAMNVAGITVERNSIIGRVSGVHPITIFNTAWRSSDVHFRHNLMSYSSNIGFNQDTTAAVLPGLATTMPGLYADQYPRGGWASNVLVPGSADTANSACWISSEVGCNSAASYWTGFPVALVPGATPDARIAAVGWLADGRVNHTSAYAGYGAALDPIEDAKGAARSIGISSASGGVFTVRWYAPSSDLCAVDRSSDNFATATRVIGVAGSLSRAQTATFTGTPSGTWAVRVNCRKAVGAGSVVVP